MSSTWSSTLCGCPFFDYLFLTLFLSVCFSYLFFFFYLNLELNLFLHVVVIGAKTTGTPPNEESGPLADNTPVTGYEPSIPDDSHHSETAEIFFQVQSSNTVPRTCLTRNSTTRRSTKRSLYHCSFRNEKNQRTKDKLITLLKKVCCQLSPFLCVTQER